MLSLSVLFICNVLNQNVYVGTIGPLIAIGPPALYYYYTERVKRPDIRFGDIQYKIQPMYIEANYSPEIGEIGQISLPHIARPAVFITTEITNEGRATAQNCKVLVNGISEEYSARWSMVNNPEKYDLLPGESQEIHLGKIFLTTDFFFLKRDWFDDLNHVLKTLFRSEYSQNPPKHIIEVDFGSSVINPPGNPQGVVEVTTNQPELLSKDHIEAEIYRPAEQPPERQDQSIRGEWWGDRQSSGVVSIGVRALAEDYKTSIRDLGDHYLPNDPIESILTQSHNVEWSAEWTENDYSEYKDDLLTALEDWNEE